MLARWGINSGLLLAAAVALAACEAPEPSLRPVQRSAPAPIVEPPLPAPSQRSQDLAAYYKRVETQLLTLGLLRQDGGGPDTPFGQRELVQNFVQIAAFSEQSQVGDRFVATQEARPIRRWTQPVRVELDFGPTTSPDLRREVTETVARYVMRLSRVTDHPMALVSDKGNFIVSVLNIDELESYHTEINRRFPDVPVGLAKQITTLPRTDHCAVIAFEQEDKPDQTRAAIALIRAEHPELLRLKCLHEEIAQGMGLINDSPAARPSIFNDDDEFALLTTQDEMMLRMLYDDRLPLGAGPEQTARIAKVIASELLGGES